MFPHKDVQKYTWTSLDGRHQIQIEYVAVRSQFKRSVKATRAHRGANVGSDHSLVITKAKLKLNSISKKQVGAARYRERKLRKPEGRQQFQLELRNIFSILQMPDQNDTDEDDHQNSEQRDPTSNIEQRR